MRSCLVRNLSTSHPASRSGHWLRTVLIGRDGRRSFCIRDRFLRVDRRLRLCLQRSLTRRDGFFARLLPRRNQLDDLFWRLPIPLIATLLVFDHYHMGTDHFGGFH